MGVILFELCLSVTGFVEHDKDSCHLPIRSKLQHLILPANEISSWRLLSPQTHMSWIHSWISDEGSHGCWKLLLVVFNSGDDLQSQKGVKQGTYAQFRCKGRKWGCSKDPVLHSSWKAASWKMCMSKEMEMCYSIQKHVSIWLLELNRKIRRILSLLGISGESRRS